MGRRDRTLITSWTENGAQCRSDAATCAPSPSGTSGKRGARVTAGRCWATRRNPLPQPVPDHEPHHTERPFPVVIGVVTEDGHEGLPPSAGVTEGDLNLGGICAEAPPPGKVTPQIRTHGLNEWLVQPRVRRVITEHYFPGALVDSHAPADLLFLGTQQEHDCGHRIRRLSEPDKESDGNRAILSKPTRL